ncbi:MAG: hypothetical protein GY858_01430 [Candidatus Omnitrophica bacterium]|nr:hypothetical protein [Candidatus Omnitrophota bacterium]
MKQATQKALNDFIELRDKVDAIVDSADPGDPVFKSAFRKLHDAKEKYYALFAQEMGWSKEEIDEWFKGAGLTKGNCKNNCKIPKIPGHNT